MMESYYIGVDVGTASVRAALITHDGRIVSSATKPLQIWQPLTDYYEQSSEDVWRNVCLVVKVFSKFLFCVCDPLEVFGRMCPPAALSYVVYLILYLSIYLSN